MSILSHITVPHLGTQVQPRISGAYTNEVNELRSCSPLPSLPGRSILPGLSVSSPASARGKKDIYPLLHRIPEEFFLARRSRISPLHVQTQYFLQAGGPRASQRARRALTGPRFLFSLFLFAIARTMLTAHYCGQSTQELDLRCSVQAGEFCRFQNTPGPGGWGKASAASDQHRRIGPKDL